MDALQSLENKVRQLPRDEGGSVLLLSGIMAFLIAIMALFALDTSQAVYNRITAQNAADAAAETAALWQARGLNLIQILNNFHYNFNVALFTTETSQLTACAAAPAAVAAIGPACAVGALTFSPEDCEAAIELAKADCNWCKQAGPENDYQRSTATAILNMQSGISAAFLLLEVTYASQAAQQSGADPILTVISGPGGYLSSIISGFGSITGLNLPTGDIPSLPGLGIYAMPLPPLPSSLSLNVRQVQGKYFPWRWSLLGSDVDEEAAKILADGVHAAASGPCWLWPVNVDFVGTYLSPSDWGWDDSYYQGHPGYMTWVAGKTNQTELAGLGMLRWLNGGQQTPTPIHYSFMNQDSYQWYVGSATNSTSSLQIPAFIGLASSQVEGTGVIGKDISLSQEFFELIGNLSSVNSLSSFVNALSPLGNVPVDSAPHLISVYIDNTSGASLPPPLTIFH
jgi:hypothetical protein